MKERAKAMLGIAAFLSVCVLICFIVDFTKYGGTFIVQCDWTSRPPVFVWGERGQFDSTYLFFTIGGIKIFNDIVWKFVLAGDGPISIKRFVIKTYEPKYPIITRVTFWLGVVWLVVMVTLMRRIDFWMLYVFSLIDCVRCTGIAYLNYQEQMALPD